jgi:FtsH-binding integral membrane protein
MADTAKGLPAIFAFTGVMGAALGPMLNYYVALPGGPSMVMQALGRHCAGLLQLVCVRIEQSQRF